MQEFDFVRLPIVTWLDTDCLKINIQDLPLKCNFKNAHNDTKCLFPVCKGQDETNRHRAGQLVRTRPKIEPFQINC